MDLANIAVAGRVKNVFPHVAVSVTANCTRLCRCSPNQLHGLPLLKFDLDCSHILKTKSRPTVIAAHSRECKAHETGKVFNTAITMRVNQIDFQLSNLILRRMQSAEVLNDKPIQRDQYGNPILPGYRPPFQKGYDPRRGKGPKVGFKFVTIAQASRLILKMEQVIDELRAEKKSRKSTKKPQLAGKLNQSTRDSKVAPISPTITPQSVDQNASQVKPEGVKSAVSPVVSPKPTIAPTSQPVSQTSPEPDDDCPF